MNLHAQLADYRRYEAQIEKLHLKHGHSPKLYELKQQGVSLASMCLDRRKVARLLAATVARGEYELGPAQTRWITVNNKQRLIYVFRLTDLILHGVLSSIISDRMRPLIAPQLYSYIKGRSWRNGVFAFADFVRAHRNRHPDPRTRGLYVLRRDIRKYSDSIPVGDDSRLWLLLNQILGSGSEPVSQRHWELVQKIVRPDISSDQGIVGTNERGVPTGSPISTVLFNLYLMPMDHELGAIPGAYYARYCDDFLFAHEDPAVVKQVDRRIDEILASVELESSKEKSLTFYFNGAGKASAAWEQARGTVAVPFLGCSVSFDGTVSLPRKKVRHLLRDVAARARRTRQALQGAAPQQAGPIICAAVNHALDSTFPFRHKAAGHLRRVVTDRRQLRQLDYHIARIVARVVTGTAGVKAFQRIPYRTLRKNWQLVSLYHSRNAGAR